MVDSARWLGGWSNTSGGIRLVKNAVFSRSGGDRPSVPNVCVLVTDGPSNRDAARTVTDAAVAKGNNNMKWSGVGWSGPDRTGPDRTGPEPNRTEPNRTEPNRTELNCRLDY